MLKKLLWRSKTRRHIIGAAAGSLTGFILLLSAGQFYFDMKKVIATSEDLINPDFIIINKQVSLLDNLTQNKNTFSPGEIDNIRRQGFATDVAGFVSNDFVLSAYAESDRFPDFYTDLFFEAIPDKYVDARTENWSWKRGQTMIPIILPRDYLNLYNFGFAPSQGLPQLSPSLIRLISFHILIRGNGKQAEFTGRIAGFSNRISTILVPWDFLNWANSEYGRTKEPRISRLVIVSKNPADPRISSFLEKNGYETVSENLKSSRLNIILKFIISFLGGLGLLVILLAMMIFILSFQLMINSSSENIRKLSLLGYHYVQIAKTYILQLVMIVGIIGLLTASAMIFIKRFFVIVSAGMGMDPGNEIHPAVIIGGTGLLLVVLAINILIILRHTKNCTA
jgi:hypothetical protein